jgi:hypothetical protein
MSYVWAWGPNRQTSGESASLPQYLGCNTVFDMRLRVTFLRRKTVRITSIKHCAPRISSKMATIDECIEFALKNIGLWWRYRISRHCDEWKYIIIERIFESEIILIPPSLKISESSFNGSYRNTDEVWWRYGISRSCDECLGPLWPVLIVCLNFKSRFFQCVFSWLLNILTLRFYYVCWQFVPCIHHSLRKTVFPNIGSWVVFLYILNCVYVLLYMIHF